MFKFRNVVHEELVVSMIVLEMKLCWGTKTCSNFKAELLMSLWSGLEFSFCRVAVNWSSLGRAQVIWSLVFTCQSFPVPRNCDWQVPWTLYVTCLHDPSLGYLWPRWVRDGCVCLQGNMEEAMGPNSWRKRSSLFHRDLQGRGQELLITLQCESRGRACGVMVSLLVLTSFLRTKCL